MQQVNVPEEIVEALSRDAWGARAFGLDVLCKYGPLIVAAHFERVALDYDDTALEFDRQSADQVRDHTLHLTGKAIGFERAARDLRVRAAKLRGVE